MGKVIISIQDPLALSEDSIKVPLLLGDQVDVSILSGTYHDIIKLPRAAVFNNQNIWLVTDDNKLQYKAVNIVWSDGNFIYIKADEITNKSLVLNTGINNPVENLVVRPTILNLSEEEIKAQEELQKEKQGSKNPTNAAPRMENENNTGNPPQSGMREGGMREGKTRPEGAAREGGRKAPQDSSEKPARENGE